MRGVVSLPHGYGHQVDGTRLGRARQGRRGVDQRPDRPRAARPVRQRRAERRSRHRGAGVSEVVATAPRTRATTVPPPGRYDATAPPSGPPGREPRRSGSLLTALDVPAEEAPAAFAAVRRRAAGPGRRDAGGRRAHRPRGPVGGRWPAATPGCVATQMLLDLTGPVAAPARVVAAADDRRRVRGVPRPDRHGVRAGDGRRRLLRRPGHRPGGLGALDPGELARPRDLDVPRPPPVDPRWTARRWWASSWIHVDGAKAYIYDIEVRDEQRRRGYGREMLDAGAAAASELGARTLGLNVFGHNDGARATGRTRGLRHHRQLPGPCTDSAERAGPSAWL